tara:strand:+ start:85 stop:897 length:813 start_codon:yes stop_codon:yes gene_type:complete
MTVYRPFTEKLGASDPATFVGNYGELFYNADTQQVRISDGSTPGGLPIAGGGGSSLSNISDASYGVNVTGKIQADGIDLGSNGINASVGSTLVFDGTTISFGSATITGGNAFNSVINTHIWAGGTSPTDGYVLSWNASLLSGAGDYEWVAQSSGGVQSSITDGQSTLSFDSSNNISIDTHIIPDTNAAYDLGNAEYKIRHLFLSDNSLTMGDTTLSEQNIIRSVELGDEPVPNAPNELGRKGDIRVSPEHLYICVEENQWRRVSLDPTWV